jgi:DNA-binding CsgD family transcriptional regulator/PAS domain-containing protein
MVRASADLLELVGAFHEGVVDDDAWRRALDTLCATLDTRFLFLGVVDHGKLGSLYGHRMPRAFVDKLAETHGSPEENPWMGAAASEPLRRPQTIESLGGRDALERTAFWKEFYRPFGIIDTAGAVLERQPGYADVVKVGRLSGQSLFRSAEMKAFGALIPHLARAWRVKRTLLEWQTLAGSLTFVLDRLQRAIVVTGADGEVRFANRAADRLLSRGDALGARRGRLFAARQQQSGALESLIARAARTGIGDDAVALDAVSLPSTGDYSALAVVAEPLSPAHGERLGHAATAGAVLFIGDSDASTRPPAECLAHVYGLTPAEARLAALIVEGEDLSAAARTMHVSLNTVKYHLKTVFEKVGVTRQTQLVRRVLADVGGLAEPDKLTPSAATGSTEAGSA